MDSSIWVILEVAFLAVWSDWPPCCTVANDTTFYRLSRCKRKSYPLEKVSGKQNILLNDLNLRSLVSIAMHLNPSTNNEIGHFPQGDNHYCYTGGSRCKVSVRRTGGESACHILATVVWLEEAVCPINMTSGIAHIMPNILEKYGNLSQVNSQLIMVFTTEIWFERLVNYRVVTARGRILRRVIPGHWGHVCNQIPITVMGIWYYKWIVY
jgi:hypothetical protein